MTENSQENTLSYIILAQLDELFNKLIHCYYIYSLFRCLTVAAQNRIIFIFEQVTVAKYRVLIY